MNKDELLFALETAYPALFGSDLIPLWTNFCFRDGKVQAWNDNIGIECPAQDVPFNGLVEGSILYGLIKNTPQNEIKLEAKKVKRKDKNGLYLFINGKEMNLPVDSTENFTWSFPNDDIIGEIEIDNDWAEALKRCLLTSDGDANHPARMGITFDFSEDYVNINSTNRVSISDILVKESGLGFVGRYCTPSALSKTALHWKSKGRTPVLRFHHPTKVEIDERGKEYTKPPFVTVVAGENKEFRMHGKLNTLKPMNFVKIINANLGDTSDDLIDVPSGMDNVLTRAQIILDKDKNGYFALRISDNKIRMWVESKRGELDMSFKIKGVHRDAEIRLSPKHVNRVLKFAEKGGMSISDESKHLCLVLSEGNWQCLISGHPIPEQE